MKEAIRGRAEGRSGLHRRGRGFLRLPGRHPHLHLDAKAGIALTDTLREGRFPGHDNEIGYSNKVLELIKHMYSVDHK